MSAGGIGTKGSAYCLTRRPREGLSLRGRAAAITRAHWRRLPLGDAAARFSSLRLDERVRSKVKDRKVIEYGVLFIKSNLSFRNVQVVIRSRTSDVDYGRQEQDGRPSHGRRCRGLHRLLHLCGSLPHGITV